jgi:hypothetical protein
MGNLATRQDILALTTGIFLTFGLLAREQEKKECMVLASKMELLFALT